MGATDGVGGPHEIREYSRHLSHHLVVIALASSSKQLT